MSVNCAAAALPTVIGRTRSAHTNLIAGTIFAATKVPLGTWFRAMYHLTQSKGGISSIEFGRRLGVTQTRPRRKFWSAKTPCIVRHTYSPTALADYRSYGDDSRPYVGRGRLPWISPRVVTVAYRQT
jgi:hypothetical protein